jgi:hypothetical protein
VTEAHESLSHAKWDCKRRVPLVLTGPRLPDSAFGCAYAFAPSYGHGERDRPLWRTRRYGGLWPLAPVDRRGRNDRSRGVTDVGFVEPRTEKGRLPPMNSGR